MDKWTRHLNDLIAAINYSIMVKIKENEELYTLINTDQNYVSNYPIEFLNSFTANGPLVYRIALKISVPIMLLQNLGTQKLNLQN